MLNSKGTSCSVQRAFTVKSLTSISALGGGAASAARPRRENTGIPGSDILVNLLPALLIC